MNQCKEGPLGLLKDLVNAFLATVIAIAIDKTIVLAFIATVKLSN